MSQFRVRTFLLLPLLLLIAATLSSCATLKKGDFLEGDWATIGYKDGSAGRRSVVMHRLQVEVMGLGGM